MERLEYSFDVLIVGGGIGGAHAALRAAALGARVALVEKARVARAGPMTYVHSQFAPDRRLKGEELQDWASEFVVGANYLADQDWVEQYLRESYDRINDQISWGVPYTRRADGSLKYVAVRGHRVGTTLGVDGRRCMEILRKRLIAARVKLFEKVAVVDLLTSDGLRPTKGRVTGAIGIGVRTGQVTVFKAKTVILNVGPFYPKMHYAFADHCTGEGHAAAWRVGAEFAGMEFAQFAAWSYFNKSFFTPGQAKIQGIGAHFINKSGERFMSRYDPIWGEKAGLFQVARAIITENIEGRGPCYLDLRHVPQADLEILYEVSPSVKRAFEEFAVNPAKDTLELGPFVVIGTMSGSGPHIDLNSATNIPGLYAVGYGTSCPHLMSGISGSGISSFSAVGGYRAGEHAAGVIAQVPMPTVHEAQIQESLRQHFEPMRKVRQVRPSDVWIQIGKVTATPEFALFKTEERIRRAIIRLEQIRDKVVPKMYAPDFHELEKASEVRNYVDMAILACKAMIERKESRGELFRVDYPYMDNDNWLKWLMVRLSDTGEPEFRTVNPDYARWPIKPPRGVTPSPYTVPMRFQVQDAA